MVRDAASTCFGLYKSVEKTSTKAVFSYSLVSSSAAALKRCSLSFWAFRKDSLNWLASAERKLMLVIVQGDRVQRSSRTVRVGESNSKGNSLGLALADIS